MAFLRKQGASGNYTFDVIYSAFQKLMRRNDVDTCIELANCFDDIVSWLNTSINVIKSATYLSKYNKAVMVKQAKQLLDIANWKF